MPSARRRKAWIVTAVVVFAVIIIIRQLRVTEPVGDWPQWRCDANRSGACPGELPARLHLQWVRQYPVLEQVWEDPVNRDRMPFDRVYEPVVMGSTLFFGSSRNDRVTALDTRTGQEKWRFYTDGPVRLAPVASDGRLYVTGDDGYLYCLDASTGKPLWTFRGGPSARKVLGNGRLISTWPARGGPVLKDGTVYFTAGIWPFMGVFLYALDAETGSPIWMNDSAGQMYMSQPHGGADAFAGVAPQGALVVTGDKLLVPGGRSVPACFDATTGSLLYYHLAGSTYHDYPGAPSRKREGGSHVSAIGKFFFNHRGLNTTMYDLETGDAFIMWRRTTYPVLTDDVLYLSGSPVVALSLDSLKKVASHRRERDKESEIVRDTRRYRWELDKLWECPVDGTGSLIKVGRRLYAGGKDVVSGISLGGSKPRVTWSATIEGTAARLIAGDGRLLVVTLEGRIYAFGADAAEPKIYPPEGELTPPSEEPSARVAEMLKSVSVTKGYCLAFGLEEGDLVEAIARHSELQVIAVDADPTKVDALRRRFDRTGLYGTRISVHQGEAATFGAPPYLATLIVSESLRTADLDKGDAFAAAIFHSLRPYGGVAWLPLADDEQQAAFRQHVVSAGLEGANVRPSSDRQCLLLSRDGPLPGSATWTHMYGDVANTVKSNDQRVRPPLGLLWFGGNTHMDVLPRHSHGPSEQVAGGRLFIEGDNCLSARDVYTGRVLWKRTFGNLGTFGVYYDRSYTRRPLNTSYNQQHIPGANARGTNFVVTEDEVYLIIGGDCLVLDAVTGETVRTISLPAEGDPPTKPTWGYIGLYEDLLIAGSRMIRFSEADMKKDPLRVFDTSSSNGLVVMNRRSGRVLWSRPAQHAFRHSAIAIGNGRLFCIDNLPHPVAYRLLRRGRTPNVRPTLMCLDVRTGRVRWQTAKAVFGTWLGYSTEHDLLLQSGRSSADMVPGEPSERMIVLRGRDGSVVWDRDVRHGGPCMLHGKTVYLNGRSSGGGAVSLLTGEERMRRHPLTGEVIPWRYHRRYGCDSVVASEHLLTFRSGAAGYYDLKTESGTGNLGGFKSGCTSNLIVADGVLNAPDYTRTCTCTYQNQTSLALVHSPEVEVWTCGVFRTGAGDLTGIKPSSDYRPAIRIRRMGLNLGAPGDRMAPDGTLWLEWPIVGGASPTITVEVEPSQASERSVFTGKRLCYHSSRIAAGTLPWVVASGLAGVRSLTIDLADGTDSEENLPPGETVYRVRLYFAELEGLGSGKRTFDVAIQGQTVLENFDIAAEADGPMREVVREFTDVRAGLTLNVTFTPKTAEPLVCGIELIAEEEPKP